MLSTESAAGAEVSATPEDGEQPRSPGLGTKND